jgi:hypothetical protein
LKSRISSGDDVTDATVAKNSKSKTDKNQDDDDLNLEITDELVEHVKMIGRPLGRFSEILTNDFPLRISLSEDDLCIIRQDADKLLALAQSMTNNAVHNSKNSQNLQIISIPKDGVPTFFINKNSCYEIFQLLIWFTLFSLDHSTQEHVFNTTTRWRTPKLPDQLDQHVLPFSTVNERSPSTSSMREAQALDSNQSLQDVIRNAQNASSNK